MLTFLKSKMTSPFDWNEAARRTELKILTESDRIKN